MKDEDGVKLGPVTKPPDGIAYCNDCGEYLVDYVGGYLYKFGRMVTEPHVCPGELKEYECPIKLTREYCSICQFVKDGLCDWPHGQDGSVSE